MKLHQANHLIFRRKLSQSINSNEIYRQWQKYCESPVVCDLIFVLVSCINALLCERSSIVDLFAKTAR